jgi:hypothetical protein
VAVPLWSWVPHCSVRVFVCACVVYVDGVQPLLGPCDSRSAHFPVAPPSALKWTFATTYVISASPTMSLNGSAVYVGADNMFYAINAATGALLVRVWVTSNCVPNHRTLLPWACCCALLLPLMSTLLECTRPGGEACAMPTPKQSKLFCAVLCLLPEPHSNAFD